MKTATTSVLKHQTPKGSIAKAQKGAAAFYDQVKLHHAPTGSVAKMSKSHKATTPIRANWRALGQLAAQRLLKTEKSNNEIRHKYRGSVAKHMDGLGSCVSATAPPTMTGASTTSSLSQPHTPELPADKWT